MGGQPPRRPVADPRRPRPRLSQGRAHVAFDDVRHFAAPVLQHRVLLNYDGQAENVILPEVIGRCLERLSEEQS